MAREIWSTDFVTDSRTGTDGPLWWGESAQEGCQRTLSRTRGRERTVRCGGESPRRRAVNGPLRVTDSRTGTDGPLWLGRVHAGGRITLNLTCLRESMIDRGSSPRERAG